MMDTWHAAARPYQIIMAGLVPAIDVFVPAEVLFDVDARDKRRQALA
jgi:hypothetical protein